MRPFWKRSGIVASLIAFSSFLLLAAPVTAQASSTTTSSPAVSYVNTLANQRADPHIFKHTDGWYYFTATVPAFDRIILRRAQSIQALGDAAETTVWRRKSSGVGSGQVWAPEIRMLRTRQGSEYTLTSEGPPRLHRRKMVYLRRFGRSK